MDLFFYLPLIHIRIYLIQIGNLEFGLPWTLELIEFGSKIIKFSDRSEMAQATERCN